MRLLDREHMRPFGFDLWNYDDVRARAGEIVSFLVDGLMPPLTHGGPWPQEWIDLFVRWKDTEFQRLDIGTASGGITAAQSGSIVTLTAKGRVPSSGFAVWLNLERVNGEKREYRLVQEPPVTPVPGPERPFTARERLDTGGTSVTLSVTDSQGTHDVPIAGGNFLHILGPFERVARELAGAGIALNAAPRVDTPTTIKLDEHELHLTGDDMFTEVSGSPEALELLSRRVRRARR